MVQKKKPPINGKPFQKGQSGNPSGRPKVPVEVKEAARAHTADAIATLAEVMKNPEESGTARVSAAETLLSRGWGKPAQHVEVDVRTAVVDFLASIGPVAAGASAADDPPLAH